MFDHRDLLVTLALQHGWKVGALLGIGSGSLMFRLLDEVPFMHVVGVDHFVRQDRKKRVLSAIGQYAGRCVVHVCKTSQAAPYVADSALDFVFVDAGHKYGCVRSDIRLWWPKVRTGGWFGGHAYDDDHPGVVAAVSERFGSSVSTDGHSVWSVQKLEG